MAEVTGLRNNALPYPVYGVPYGVEFPILDADGDLVPGAASLDSERSLNGDTFADCTNEATEIATSSGMYYLLLTAAELTADAVAVIVKTGTAGAKTTPMVLYPRKLVSLRSGTVGANAADGSTLQLDSGAVAIDDYYNGCLLVGTLDSNVEARIISDYVGSTKVCSVSPNFVTTPDNNDTFVVYLPEGKQVIDANVATWLATVPLALSSQLVQVLVNSIAANAITAAAIATDAIDADAIADNAINAGAIASGAITAAKFAAGAIDAAAIADNAIDAGAIAADAITAAKIADGAIDAATFAAGAITAAAIATGAVDADALAADAVAEIADGVWDEDATGHQTQGTFGQAIGDPGADTDTIYGLVNGIQADTDDIQGRLPAALVGGRIDASVGAMAANTLTASALAADAVAEIQSGLALEATAQAIKAKTDNLPADPADESNVLAAIAGVLADTNDIQTRLPAALVGGRMDSDVGAMQNNTVTAAALAADAAVEIAAAVLARAMAAKWGSFTVEQALGVILSTQAAKTSGGATTTFTIRDVADGTDVVVATVDADGNRSAVTVTP